MQLCPALYYTRRIDIMSSRNEDFAPDKPYTPGLRNAQLAEQEQRQDTSVMYKIASIAVCATLGLIVCMLQTKNTGMEHLV